MSFAPLTEGVPPCGPSSAQAFSGEDMGREARIKAQKLQLRDWYEQQVFEKSIAAEMSKNADGIFTTQNDLAAQNLLEVEKAEAAMRAELEHSRQEYNRLMESSKNVLKQEEKMIT